MLLLLPDWAELLALPGHELERPPFREPHLHPLKELELPWELPVPLGLYGWFFLLRRPSPVQRRVEELKQKEQLLDDVEEAVEAVSQLLQRLEQPFVQRRVDAVHLRVLYSPALDPLLPEAPTLPLKAGSHAHV